MRLALISAAAAQISPNMAPAAASGPAADMATAAKSSRQHTASAVTAPQAGPRVRRRSPSVGASRPSTRTGLSATSSTVGPRLSVQGSFVQEEIDGAAGDQVEGFADGGQWDGEFADDGDVVVADEGQVIGNPQAAGGGDGHDTDGVVVVDGEDRGGRVGEVEQDAGGGFAGFHLGILIPMSAHQRAEERIADLVAQEFDVFRAAYVQVLVRRACLARLAPAATRPGHP